MNRIFAVVYMLMITYQCYMHNAIMGYHSSIIFWWLLNFAFACLLIDGYKLKK